MVTIIFPISTQVDNRKKISTHGYLRLQTAPLLMQKPKTDTLVHCVALLLFFRLARTCNVRQTRMQKTAVKRLQGERINYVRY